MNLFSNIRVKRRTVFAVLLVWLFALSASWANACLLQERGMHVHGGSDGASLVAKVPNVSAGHVGAVPAHDVTPGVAEGACRAVGDDGTQTLVRLPPSSDLSDAAMAPTGPFSWSAHAAALSADASMLELLPPRRDVPMRTLFSRLAL